MINNFLEIQNTTFVASKLNKVLDFNLTIKNEGDIICLLGPSGIGKTTILRSIAGLQKIPKGLILLKGKTLSSKNVHVEPEKRNIALSFQDNSLFPHYTILDNINFGSKRNRNAKYKFRAKELIELLHLEGLEQKFPHQISAGEAQRVSLARSLMSKPDLLLLDEPFSNIDESLKVELQLNIKKILKKNKITTIMVTHDSYEAFYMADYCGIILSQTMKQYDTPYNIHHYPNCIDVVNFLNKGILVDAKVLDDNSVEHKCLGIIKGDFVKKYPKGTAVKLLVQPEDLEHDDKSKLQLKIIDRKFRGTNFIYTLKTKNNDLIPVFVHSHHIHQHEVEENFGIKTPIYIDHLVCF
jgi:iron(III) transport system ATP-binding protein|tara:strand:+ start:61 stop:1119 length:1059 start_codon:yes stop_codon:yes gene_type:complete